MNETLLTTMIVFDHVILNVNTSKSNRYRSINDRTKLNTQWFSFDLKVEDLVIGNLS